MPQSQCKCGKMYVLQPTAMNTNEIMLEHTFLLSQCIYIFFHQYYIVLHPTQQFDPKFQFTRTER